MSIADFLDFMPDTVTLYAYASRSVSGAPSYSSTGVSYRCRIEMKNHLVVDTKGQTVLARGRVFLGSATVPGVLDKVTLPSEYVPNSPPILAVNVEPDENGSHHTVLEIG